MSVNLITLHCESGDHPWERPSQRGRKPRNCPTHSELPVAVSVPSAPNTEGSMTSTEEGDGPAVKGVAAADRLMRLLRSRGTDLASAGRNQER